jgi:hypothetical protein
MWVRRTIFGQVFGPFWHFPASIETGLQHPRGLGRAFGRVTEFGTSAYLSGSESTATGFAFNIPVRACVSGLLG